MLASVEERLLRLECGFEEMLKGASIYFADKEALEKWRKREEGP